MDLNLDETWFHPRGALAREDWESVVDGAVPGWAHTGLRIGELTGDGDSRTLPPGDVERMVVPLNGSFAVTLAEPDADPRKITLAGRDSVFDGPTDVMYIGAGVGAVVTGRGRFAVAESPTTERLPSVHVPRDAVPVELRGAWNASRQVHNFGTPQAIAAARLIVCEVLTPSGNWSSYPPHKHDQHRAGHESVLEEIYYFEAASDDGLDDGSRDPFGMFSVSSSEAGEISIAETVRDGDIALVPYGYHGPAVAAPGYDLYYLNVMAGPGRERVWLISDDPKHAWVRDTWDALPIDPRLPFGADGRN